MDKNHIFKKSVYLAGIALTLTGFIMSARVSGGLTVLSIPLSGSQIAKNTSNLSSKAETEGVTHPKQVMFSKQATLKIADNQGQKSFGARFVGLMLLPLMGAPEVNVGYKPLSSANSQIYEQIFRLQTLGHMDEADALINQLNDYRLKGHYLYQRYTHPTAYRSNYAELKEWLIHNPDHPHADKIYKLALNKRPLGQKDNLALPEAKNTKVFSYDETMQSPKKTYVSSLIRSSEQENIISQFKRNISELLAQGQTHEAKEYFDDSVVKSLLDQIEKDSILAKIAGAYLYEGNILEASQLSKDVTLRSGEFVPYGAWIAGLSAWQLKNYILAAQNFEVVANSPYASSWLTSAGSYWAARAHKTTSQKTTAYKWLKKAAENPRTFYGLLATYELGQKFPFNWEDINLSSQQQRDLLETREGKIAGALIAAGQYALAEEELLKLNLTTKPSLKKAVLTYAVHIGLPRLSMHLAKQRIKEKNINDSALYPLLPWTPSDGYVVDPALISAIVRKESLFDPNAESPRGAKGLMQIMPTTALYVLRDEPNAAHELNERLSLPEENLRIGQKYLKDLMADKSVGDDLISLLVAYNAGQGNLSTWKARFKQNFISEDPLLFLETIPAAETRNYVEYVMANYWLYSLRAGNEQPGLNTLRAAAQGKPMRYAYEPQSQNSRVKLANLDY